MNKIDGSKRDFLENDINEESDAETVILERTCQHSNISSRRNEDLLAVPNVYNADCQISDDRNMYWDAETVILEHTFQDQNISSRRNKNLLAISNVYNTDSPISDDSNMDSDAETVILERTFQHPNINSRRNKNLLAISNVNDTDSPISDGDGCSTFPTVGLQKGTGRPEGHSLQMIGGSNVYRVKGEIKEATQKTTTKFASMNSQYPHVPGENNKQEPLRIDTFKVQAPITHSNSQAKCSCIQSTKRKKQNATKSTAVNKRKKELCISKSISSSSTPWMHSSTPNSKRMASLMANCNVTIIPIGRSFSCLPRQRTSELTITTGPQKKIIKPALVPEVSKVMIVDLTKETIPPIVDLTEETSTPIVDLTKETNLPRNSQLRRAPKLRSSQICKKKSPPVFYRAETIASSLSHICEDCTAQYPTKDRLQIHRQIYHIPGGLSLDMLISIVDLGKPELLSKLQAKGFQYMIPVTPQCIRR